MPSGMAGAVGGRSANRTPRSANQRSSNRRGVPRTGVFALALVVVLGLSTVSGMAGIVGTASAANHATVDDCGRTIDSPGTYELSGNMATTGDDPCIEITASGVTLDGQGHEIEGSDDVAGVHVHGQPDALIDRIVVEDLAVNGFRDGIEAEQVGDVRFERVDVIGSARYGYSLAKVVGGDGRARIVGGNVTATAESGIAIGESRVDVVGTSVNDPGGHGIVLGLMRGRLDGVAVSNASVNGVAVVSDASVVVEDSTITDTIEANSDGDLGLDGGDGIYVEDAVSLTIDDTTVSNAAASGIELRQVNRDGGQGPVTVRDSTISVTGEDGLLADDVDELAVARTTVERSGRDGMRLVNVGSTAEHSGVVRNSTVRSAARHGLFMGESRVDVGESSVVDAGRDGITAGLFAGELANVSVTDADRHGVHLVGAVLPDSTVRVTGRDTVIANNGGDGVNASTFTGGQSLTVRDATIADNDGRDLLTTRADVITATNVDVGASTVPGTTIDVELVNASLAGVDAIPVTPDGRSAIGRAVALQPATGSGAVANVTLAYDDSDTAGLDESTLSLWRHDGAWSDVGATVDADANTVSANGTSSGTHALLAQPATTGGRGGGSGDGRHDVGTPNISIVDATLSADSVTPGTVVSVDVELENAGDGDGVENVTLAVDDAIVDAERVLVRSNDTFTFDFEHAIDGEGEYTLAAGNVTAGTLTVAADQSTAGDATSGTTTTQQPTAPSTATESSSSAAGGAPTPDDADTGGLGLFVIVGMVAVIAGIVGGGLLVARGDR